MPAFRFSPSHNPLQDTERSGNTELEASNELLGMPTIQTRPSHWKGKDIVSKENYNVAPDNDEFREKYSLEGERGAKDGGDDAPANFPIVRLERTKARLQQLIDKVWENKKKTLQLCMESFERRLKWKCESKEREKKSRKQRDGLLKPNPSSKSGIVTEFPVATGVDGFVSDPMKQYTDWLQI
ncbi:hypothetical protein M426DRAFT_15988 [Hypoxylon sp. CI-4A]|nr:hypothetical protein M426DRAFT_15988 [Hypoxylon sp. CI-4A]